MSAITTGKYVGGRERIGPRNKDVIGQAIGSTLENLGTSFGENIKQQQQREIQQSLLNEFTDPNTSLQRKQAISLQLNPKSATDILNQSYIDKILNKPEENVTRPIKDVSAPFNGINNAQPEANQVPNPAPVTPVTPNINDLMSELNNTQTDIKGAPVDPYAQKRLEAEQLLKKSQQLKRFGANDIGNALQNEANQKFQDIRNSQTADAQIYRADKAAAQKEKEFQLKIHKESKAFDQKIQEEAHSAENDIRSSKAARKALATGNINPRNIQGLARTLFKGSAWEEYFNNPDISTLQAATLSEYEGARQLFGGILSDADLKIVAGKVIGSDKTVAQNLAILDFRDLQNNAKILEAKIGDQVKKENGGFRPIDYEGQVKKRLEEMIGEEVRQVASKAINENKEIFNPKNPTHRERRQEILDSVKGNRQEANAILAQEFK